ncbi:cartilage oligomeric matrix protein-like [Penaeus japonicus]|uniref:cartilage oligomeric matrix protein-like n=1 Tax=Penaeus japonicus TaxID=27405 RepID=UPI001C70DF72|nr:cartilage oligomeric matrix protein-like [Penaeus japonicus]
MMSFTIIFGVVAGTAMALPAKGPRCLGEGRFPNPSTCGEFFDCIPDGSGGYESLLNDCNGFAYDATSRTCSGEIECHSRSSRSVTTAYHLYSYLCEGQPDAFVCADCRTMVMCVKGQAFVRQCTSGKACYVSATFGGGVCYPGLPAECTCQKADVFVRDMYDPQKFFSCSATGAVPDNHVCPDGMVFDESTVRCRNQASVPACSRPGTFANLDNCAEYYSCMPLKHGWLQRLFMCSNGTLYNEVSGACEDPCASQMVCYEEGRFPDPHDRRNYYECLTIGNRIHRMRYQCPHGYVWKVADSGNGGSCVEDSGLTLHDYSTRCSIPSGMCPDGTDLCVTNNGGCNANADCTTSGTVVTCTCKAGYTGDGMTCTDIDECLVNNGGCDGNANCQNVPGGRVCKCRAGFTGDGLACSDVDECLVSNGGCDTNAQCSNTVGSRDCKCLAGFTGDGLVCKDVDECLVGNGGCHAKAQCTNTVGSRNCSCLPGYIGDGFGCAGACELQPCFAGVTCTFSQVAPFYTCGPCPAGFSGNGITCENLECPVGFAGDGVVCGPDSDIDGYPDSQLACTDKHCNKDNCVNRPNSGQEDADGDGLGDSCDDDADGDGRKNPSDNCPLIVNPGQEDKDSDGTGNLCDNCPSVKNSNQKDVDLDGLGDACDPDIDNDGLANDKDNCPSVANSNQGDVDGDGVGDLCDNCPTVANSGQADSDQDLVGNKCDGDTDADRDGIDDSVDNCPGLHNSAQVDVDSDGAGDVCDSDSDNDGINDDLDNCMLIPNADQKDFDGDGRGDACITDRDGDLIIDSEDNCILNPNIHKTDFTNLQMVNLQPSSSVAPKWVVYDGGAEIHQNVNSAPGLAVGDASMESVDFEGTFFIEDTSDDDYVGFTFSYQSNAKFYAMMWKKANQGTGLKGVQLRLVNSATGPSNALADALWKTATTTNQVKLLWHDSSIGWKPRVAYRWQLHHRPEIGGVMRFYLYNGNTLVIDSGNLYDETLLGGRMGVFCLSQPKIIWSNMKYSCNRDIPQAIFDDLPQSLKNQVQATPGITTRTKNILG